MALVKDKIIGNIKYSGEVDAEGRPHGRGEYVVISKDEFEGDACDGMFVHGKRSGIARYRYKKSGTIYIAMWRDDKRNDVGYDIYPDGTALHASI